MGNCLNLQLLRFLRYLQILSLVTASFLGKCLFFHTGATRVNFKLVDTQISNKVSSSHVSPSFKLNVGDVSKVQSTAVIWTVVPDFSSKFSRFSTEHSHIDQAGQSRITSKQYFSSFSHCKPLNQLKHIL